MEPVTSFGYWVRRQRKALDLTQDELARRVGCASVTIKKIEADQRRPSEQIAELLAEALNVPTAERPLFLKVARSEQAVDRLSPPASTVLNGSTPNREAEPAPRSKLPVPPTPLIGREAELAQVAWLLQDPTCQLLTLVGAGGIGKTRLAIQAATDQQEAFADGVYFVSLAGVSASEFIIPAIAEAVGFTFYGATDPKMQLLRYLRDKEMLLVLDNFEHLLDGADVVAELMEQASPLKLLATSREQLNLPGEWVFEVQGLPVPETTEAADWEANSAVALFLQRARRAQVGFTLDAAARAAVTDICRLVEGMPLGIELAAAWVRTLSCREIAQEIAHNLDFLSAPGRTVAERHRSLRAVFDYSWKLLTPKERELMRRLSVFQGGFQREAAEEVAGATLPLLSALIDKSLLRRTAQGRYHLHELVRQYANAKLIEVAQEATATRHRHTHYYLSLLHEHALGLQGPRQHGVLSAIALEIANIRLAWEWAVEHQHLALLKNASWPLWYFYELRNYFQEGERVFQRAQQKLRALPPGSEGEHGEREVVLGEMLTHQGFSTWRLGRSEEGAALVAEALTLLRSHEKQAALVHALWCRGALAWAGGRFAEADAALQEGLLLCDTYGRPWHAPVYRMFLGVVRHEQGAYEEAYEWFQQALEVARDLGDPRTFSYGTRYLSRTAHVLARYDEMLTLAHQGLEAVKESYDHFSTGLALEQLALATHLTGNHAEANRIFDESLRQYREIEDGWSLSRLLNCTGWLTLTEGDLPRAQRNFTEALQTAVELYALPHLLDALVGLATVSSQHEPSANTLGLVEYALQHPSCPQEVRDRAENIRLELEALLPNEQIETARAATRTMTLDEVVAAALKQP